MKQFDFLSPGSFAEACQMLAEGGEEVRPLAGGTALVILAKSGVYAPKAVVALKLIPGHNEITADAAGGLRIGALVSQRALETSDAVRHTHPVLNDAAILVGNIRVRVMSTVGGTVCEADPQADVPGTLIALGARVETLSPAGSRILDLADFYVGPYETVLQRGELVTAVLVPPLPAGVRGIYLKHTTGPISDRPCVGVCAVGGCDTQGRISHLRVVLNGVGPRPLILTEAQALVGQRPADVDMAALAAAAAAACEPVSDLRGSEWYKREMALVFTTRALRDLFGGELK